MARVIWYEDRRTTSYAELWSADQFAILRNTYWWPDAGPLGCEHKGDERGLGMPYKIDIPGPCWVVWYGTVADLRILQTQQSADVGQLDGGPGASFLPVYPGVNVIEFEVSQ